MKAIMMTLKFLCAGLIAGLIASAGLADVPVLRVAVLKFGTVNWELNTIRHHGLDTSNGFTLDVQGMAGSAAAKVAFQGGATDVIVSDWLWVARQRAAGKDYVFIPYSKAVGGVIVPKTSPARSLADLKSEKIGIAGGPLDKSWLILRAYAEKTHGLDLMADTQQVYAAPPLIFQTAISGDLAASVNFWHFTARLEAAGLRKLIDVADAARDLGLDPDAPLLGYVVHGSLIRDTPDLVAGLAAASLAAKDILSEPGNMEWDRLRPVMNAKSDADFNALRSGFIAGIPAPGPVDEAAADKFLKLMLTLGGPGLMGRATELPAGTFWTGGT